MSASQFKLKVYEAGLAAGLSEPAARVMAAQAALETGNGKSSIGNNIFGIKAGSSWKGEKQLKWTWEEEGGKKVKKKAWFRDYATPEEGLVDRIALMDKRWPGFNQAKTVDEAYAALKIGQKGGYATDSEYVDKLRDIENTIPGAKPLPPGDIPTAVASELDTFDPSGGATVAAGSPTPAVMSEGLKQQRQGVLDSLLNTIDSGLLRPTVAETGSKYPAVADYGKQGADLKLLQDSMSPALSERTIQGGGVATPDALNMTPTVEALMAGGKPVARPPTYVDAMAPPIPPKPATPGNILMDLSSNVLNTVGAMTKAGQDAMRLPTVTMPDKNVQGALIEAGKNGLLSGFVRDKVASTIGAAAGDLLEEMKAKTAAAAKAREAAQKLAEQKKAATVVPPVPLTRPPGLKSPAPKVTPPKPVSRTMGQVARINAGTVGAEPTYPDVAPELKLLLDTGTAQLPSSTVKQAAKIQTSQIKLDPATPGIKKKPVTTTVKKEGGLGSILDALFGTSEKKDGTKSSTSSTTSSGANPGGSGANSGNTAGLKPGDRTYDADNNVWVVK